MRVIRKFGHRHYGVLIHRWAALTAVVGLIVFPERFLPGDIFFLVASAFSVAGMVLVLWHSLRPICQKCVEELPLDAGAQAETRKEKTALYSFHLIAAGGVKVGISMILMVAVFTVFVIFKSSVAFCAYSLFAVILNWAGARHSLLDPWCPYCNDGGRGDDEEALSPDPSGGHGRPLPV